MPLSFHAQRLRDALGVALFLPGIAGAMPPTLNESGQNAYRVFQQAEDHRAFAVAPGGGWGWSQGEASAKAAASAALDACQPHSRHPCQLYAVGQRHVFDARTWAHGWRPYARPADTARAETGPQRGQRFPNLTMTAPDGRTMSLADLRGHAVVLHFWGSWCPSCRHELPQFAVLQQAFRNKPGLAFVFVPVRETVTAARAYLKQQKLALTLHDAGQTPQTQTFRDANGVLLPDRDIAPVFPATYVIDRHGGVVFSQRGSAPDWAAYAPLLEDLRRAR